MLAFWALSYSHTIYHTAFTPFATVHIPVDIRLLLCLLCCVIIFLGRTYWLYLCADCAYVKYI